MPKPVLHPDDAAQRANGGRPYAREVGEVTVYEAVGEVKPEMRFCAFINLETHGDLVHWIMGPTEASVRERLTFYWDQQKDRWLPKIDKRRSTDPMARLAKTLDDLSDSMTERWEDNGEAVVIDDDDEVICDDDEDDL